MNNRIFIQIIVFEYVGKLDAIFLGNVPQRLTLLHHVYPIRMRLCFCFNVNNFIFNRLSIHVSIIEYSKMFNVHLNIFRDGLVCIAFFGDDKIGFVVFEDLTIAERTIARREIGADGSEDLEFRFRCWHSLRWRWFA